MADGTLGYWGDPSTIPSFHYSFSANDIVMPLAKSNKTKANLLILIYHWHNLTKMDNLIERLNSFVKKEVNKVSVRKMAFTLMLSFISIFILITAIILLHSPEEFEAIFTRSLQAQRNPVLDIYMKTISIFGERYVAISMIVCSAILFVVFGYVKEGLFMVLTSLASVLNFLLKLLIDRPRPTAQLVEVLISSKNQSFPSGHTVHYVVFFGLLMILVFRIRRIKAWIRLITMVLCLTLIFSIPFSRVYLGAHWITDVTAGFVIGMLVLSILLFFYFKYSSDRQLK